MRGSNAPLSLFLHSCGPHYTGLEAFQARAFVWYDSGQSGRWPAGSRLSERIYRPPGGIEHIDGGKMSRRAAGKIRPKLQKPQGECRYARSLAFGISFAIKIGHLLTAKCSSFLLRASRNAPRLASLFSRTKTSARPCWKSSREAKDLVEIKTQGLEGSRIGGEWLRRKG